MRKYHFPSDLAKFVYKQWNNFESDQYPSPDCPNEKILKKIFEVSYLASLEMEEGRSLTFFICCTPLSDVIKRHYSEELVETWEFEVDRELIVSELRHLATVASTESIAIWITYSEIPDLRIAIHGLVNLGSSWAIARRAVSYSYDSPPSALIINVLGSGHLSVYQGQYRVATLSSGQINGSQVEDMTSFQFLGIHEFIKEGTDLLRKLIELPIYEDPKDSYGFEWTCYTNVLIGIINVIKQMKHGGMVIVLRRKNIKNNLKKLFRVKYKINSKEILSRRYIDFMSIRNKVYDIQTVHDFYSDGENEYSNISESDKLMNHLLLVDSERLLGESIRLVGNLAGTDGSILLNTSLEVIGFGAEIISSHKYPNKTYTPKDIIRKKKEPFNAEEFGMRHRSAIRLCASTNSVFAFVISQDGGVTLIWRDDKDIMIKRNIDITNANMALG
jgi:hypothetical protein